MTSRNLTFCPSSNLPIPHSLHPTDQRTMIRSVTIRELPVVRAAIRAGAKEHVIEHAQAEAVTIDRQRRRAKYFFKRTRGHFIAAMPGVQVSTDDERAAWQRRCDGSYLHVAHPRRPEQPQAPSAAKSVEMHHCN